MADETDSADKRPPHAPVIDLEAEAVEDPAPLPDGKPSLAPRRRRLALWGIAALALAAALAGGWLYRSYGASLWPTDAMVELSSRLATVEAEAKTAGGQIKGLGASLDQLSAGSAGLKAAIDAASGDSKAARSDAAAALAALAALNERVATVESRLKDALAAIESAGTGGAPVVTAPADAAKLKNLADRLAALETEVAAMKTAGPPQPDKDTVRLLSQTLAGLEAKIAAGAPYTEELAVITRLVPAAPGLEALATTATVGLATSAALADQLAKLIPALPGPPDAPAEDDGGWNWFTSLFDGVVTIRDLGETDWRAAAAAAQEKAAGGDLSGAITGLAGAEGGMPPALAAWLAAAKARVAGDAALEQVTAAVLRHIAALDGAP